MSTFNEPTAADINVFVSSVLRSIDLNWPKILESLQSPFKDSYSLISKAISTYPDAPWADAWSRGQLSSKLWLMTELGNIQRTFSCIYTIGGWLGVLPWLLFGNKGMSVNKIRSFDIDPSCCLIADKLNINATMDNWRFKAITADAMEMRYTPDGSYNMAMQKSNGTMSKPWLEKPDCIINTSCDHFEHLEKWVSYLPKETLVVLQNTDTRHDDTHTNTVDSLDQFVSQAKLGNILFSGTLRLDNYTRFMLIGHR